jgi:hypothetical protein
MTLASRRAVAVLRGRKWHGRMKAAQSSEALGSEQAVWNWTWLLI